MGKNIAAAGSSLLHRCVYDGPDNAQDAVASAERILSAHSSNRTNTLNEDDFCLVAHCLDIVGSEEKSIADDGSLQGREHISFEASNQSITIEVEADIHVQNVWDRSRREWACTMGVRRVEGLIDVERFTYSFHFASFGASDEGNPIVLFDFTYERVMDDPRLLSNFNKGAKVKASEYDITSNVQWGYLIVAHCDIRFADGSIIHV